MKRPKLLQNQQDLFSHADRQLQWENLKPNEQKQIIALLAEMLLSLSSDLVTHGGSPQCCQK
jgi:hypothetical protein